MSPADPTAKAALHSGDNDILGAALAQLNERDAVYVALHYGFDVPVAALVRLFKARSTRLIHNYDYLGHMHDVLATGRNRLGELLRDSGLTPGDLDWQRSRAVRDIGTQHRVEQLVPCMHCRQQKLPLITSSGRPRRYCSDSCRQAAYRKRRADPPSRDDPEHGMLPCFAGIEQRIPIEIRRGLIDLQCRGAIRMEQLTLDNPGITDLERYLARRWSPTSPLIRAARIALAYLEQRGANLYEVFLHGKDIRSRMTPYSVGFECRYLRAMPRVFTEFGGTEWLEIPRPSPTEPLIALRIQALDRKHLAKFHWD
ncbi:hypothetical protein [Amycolatopsis jejuensis]|uniref:hypothetical protein n=1 Tax=Amycolatopsis jejuensis TaxID=330084 RepID=UPI0005264BE7|nr:hypothetical protein [Amycolatopsis jejuensis]